MAKSRTRQFAACCTGVFGLVPVVCGAAQWSVESTVAAGIGIDDNVTLTTDPHDESVSSADLLARFRFDRVTETSEAEIGLLASGSNYSGEGIDSSSQQILTLRSFSQATERTRWGLDGELRRDDLFERVAATPGTGDLRDTDVGLTDTRVTRNWRTLQPSWNHLLTERTALGLRYRLTDVGYSDAAGTGLTDYKDHVMSASYSYRVTVSTDLNVAVAASRYRPDAGNDSDSRQVSAGVSHAFSETMRGRILVGTSRTTEKSTAGEVKDSGFVLEAGLTQRSELTTLEGVLSQDVHPSGAGRLVESQQLRVYYTRRISEKLEGVVVGSLFRDNVLEGTDPDIDRRYYELQPEVRWQWAPEWFFTAAYRYRSQKYDATAATAKSNAIFFGIAYAWPKSIISR